MKNLSEVDKLINRATRLYKKANWHKLQIDILLKEFDDLQIAIHELSKPGFKIPKPKKSKYY